MNYVNRTSAYNRTANEPSRSQFESIADKSRTFALGYCLSIPLYSLATQLDNEPDIIKSQVFVLEEIPTRL